MPGLCQVFPILFSRSPLFAAFGFPNFSPLPSSDKHLESSSPVVFEIPIACHNVSRDFPDHLYHMPFRGLVFPGPSFFPSGPFSVLFSVGCKCLCIGSLRPNRSLKAVLFCHFFHVFNFFHSFSFFSIVGVFVILFAYASVFFARLSFAPKVSWFGHVLSKSPFLLSQIVSCDHVVCLLFFIFASVVHFVMMQ